MAENFELNEKMEQIELAAIENCEDISPLEAYSDTSDLSQVEAINPEFTEMSVCTCSGGCGSNYSFGSCTCSGSCGSNYHK